MTVITITEGTTAIDAGAFYYCENLEHISIPDSVTKIGGKAFWGTKIKTLNHKLIKIEDGLVFSPDRKKILYRTINPTTKVRIPDGVEQIGSRAFECSSLTA